MDRTIDGDLLRERGHGSVYFWMALLILMRESFLSAFCLLFSFILFQS